MSEYNSLYIKVEINEEKLKQFFKEKPLEVNLDENWLNWWDTREMYSKDSLKLIPHYSIQNNREIFNQLLDDRNFGSVETYDKDSNTWTFISIFFSENYMEILPMLSLLQSLANYQATSDTGIAIIYDYYWDGQEIMAFMEYANQKGTLKKFKSTDEIDPVILQQANRTLELAMNKLNEQNLD